MKKVYIDYPMIRWQPVLVLLFMLGCEDPLQLGIRGIVLDESDSPIANAIVEIRGPAEKQSQRTDSAGEFFFEDLLRGEYDINTTKPGYKADGKHVVVSNKIIPVVVKLEKEDSQTISGVIRDQQTNQTMPNVQLTTDPVTYSVTSDDQGAYKFGQKMKPATYVITAKAEGYEPATITVEVVLGQPTRADISMGVKPALYVQPDFIQFGNIDIREELTIENHGTGKLKWKITVPELWITVTPSQGTTEKGSPSVITVTIDREGLKPNQPPATLTITSNTSNDETKKILVTLDVDPVPEIRISAAEFDFEQDRDSWDFLIYNKGTGTLDWEITVPEHWANARPTEGLTRDTPTSVNVRIDRETVAKPGKYLQDMVITSNGGTAKLKLLMEVLPLPELKVSRDRMDFGANAEQDVLLIENSGNGILNWKIDLPAVKWLKVSRTQGNSTPQTPVSVEISVDRSKVSDPRTYEEVLTVSGEGMVIEIPVSMVVALPKMVVDPPEIQFEAGSNQKSVVLSREGLGRIDWRLTTNADWLSITPNHGQLSENPVDLEITVDKELMVQGLNQASIEVLAEKASNSPLTIPVKADVLPTLRLLVKDRRSNKPVAGAQVLAGSTDLDGTYIAEDIQQPLVKGVVAIKEFIDQPFSFRLDQVKDAVIEKVVYLQPIPHLVKTIPTGDDLNVPKEMAVSGDGAFVYVTNNFGYSVTKIRTSADQIVKTLDLSPDGEDPLGLAVNPLTDEIYVANSYVPPGDNPVGGVILDTISIISANFNQSQKIVVGNAPTDVAVDANRRRLYVSNQASENISIIDLSQRNLIEEIHVGNTPGRLELVDNELYCTTEDGVVVIDTRLKQVTKTIRNVGLKPVDLVSDGKYLYVVNNLSDDISVVSLSSKRVVETVKVGQLPIRAAIGQEGLLYVVNQGNSKVSIVHQLNGQFSVAEETLSVGAMPQGITILPDGSKFYLALMEDSVIKVFGYE